MARVIGAAEIIAELAVVRTDHASAIPEVLPAIRALVDAETIVLYSPIEQTTGWALERFEHDRVAKSSEVASRTLHFFKSAPRRYAWFDATRPEPTQRNRVLESRDMMSHEEFMSSRISRDVFEPLGLHEHFQPRALICDGASLLAWFGAINATRFTKRQTKLLAQFLPAMRARLRLERDLATVSSLRGAFDAALEHIAAPAFLLGGNGQIFEASTSGRALLDARRGDVQRAFAAALAGTPPELDFELTRISGTGSAARYLAVLRASSTEARTAISLARATARWQLTPRQASVLELVLGGSANTTIAANLGISTRAVELHITKLFDRAGVESRVALVSAVLGS